MAKDKKQVVFGIHEITIRDYFDGVPVAALSVIGDLSLPVTAEVESLFGSGVWPVAGEAKTLTCEGSIELREFPEDIAEYLAAAVGAKTAASATGTVSALANYKGTSCFNADTGIATSTAKTGEVLEMKAGMYMVKVVSATTVDVYACSTVDQKKGTTLPIQDDALKITAEALTIATGAAVEIPDTGVELTGGSGTIGMTVGDTAYFEIWPPHAGVEVITLGAEASAFKRVALTLTAEKRTTGQIAYIECPNALCLGLPLGGPEKAWASGSVNISVFVHNTFDYAIKFTTIDGTSV